MKCFNCGAEIPEGNRYCGSCGKEVGSLQVQSRHCVSCGRAIDFNANVCQYCGYDYRIGPLPKRRSSGKRIAGGILAILCGVAGLIILTVFYGATYWSYGYYYDSGFVLFCFSLGLISSTLAFIGGSFALMGKHYGFAVVGGVFALIAFFPLGIPALILIAIARDEFETVQTLLPRV